MVELDGTWDYVLLFALVAALGAVGGFAYELTLGGRGRVEVPRWLNRGRFYDLGVWANVILGAIVAPAALSVFPPEERTTVNTAGETVTITEWNIIKVVGLSLIVGSAASTVLNAMQARTLALIKSQQTQQTEAVAQQQLDAVKELAAASGSADEVAAQVDRAKATLRSIADSGPGNPALSDF